MSTVNVSVEEAIATVSLNRPDSMNALNEELGQALEKTLNRIAADESIRVCLLTGANDTFMAGGDINYFGGALKSGKGPQEFDNLFRSVHNVIRTIDSMPQPVVAVVRGSAAGYGLSLMASCDLAIAADDTVFTLAYCHLGVSPDGGSTWSLPRLIGQRKALELALLGDRFDGKAAAAMGLVNFAVSANELDEASTKLAKRLSRGPRVALAKTKKLIRSSFNNDADTQLNLEQESFLSCVSGDEFPEGVDAFLNKRAPKFP